MPGVQIEKYKHVLIIADSNGALLHIPSDRIGYDAIDYVEVYPHIMQQCGDHYDFVAMYVDMESAYLTTLNHHSITIYNDVTGINHEMGGTNAAPFDIQGDYANTQRLRSYQVMYPEFADRYSRLHEIGHQWAAYVHGGLNNTIRNAQRHWTDVFETTCSPMAENTDRWVTTGGLFCKRTYTDADVSYCPLDLYLMGMFGSGEANPPPFYYLTNLNVSGSCYQATQHVISLQSIIQNVTRIPDELASPRTFRQAFVIITNSLQEGRDLVDGINQAGAAMVGLSAMRAIQSEDFRSATQSRGVLDTYLYDNAIYDSIYIRDNDQDTGTEPSSPPFWRSPDIWVRNQNDGGTAPQATVRGQANYIRVRVRNKGAQASGEVTVNVYQADWPGTEFLYPDDWNVVNRIGAQQIASVPAAAGGVDGQSIVTFPWPAAKIPPSTWQHPCLLAEIIPIHPTLTELRHVYEDRRLAQRNITIVDAPQANQWSSFTFSVGANSTGSRWISLKIVQEAGIAASNTELDFGSGAWDGRIQSKTPGVTVLIEHGRTRVTIPEPLSGATVSLKLMKAERIKLTLKLKWNTGFSPNSSQFEVTQLNEGGKPVGGVSLEIQSQ